jgi:hypothetical protein
MGGSVALPVVVEVAFDTEPLDTGTLTWTDISDYVKRGSGVNFERGWDTEAAEPLSGRLSFTLNNDSGDFTPGSTGAFGLIRNRLPVRISATVATATGNALTYDDEVGWYDMFGATYNDAEIGNVVLWTGLVESWRIFWENGVRPQVAVQAVDRWAAIRRLKLDGKFIERITMSQGPTHFWPATDIDGSDRLTATVGPDLVPVAGVGTLDYAAVANPQTWLQLPTATAAQTGGSGGVRFVDQSFVPYGSASFGFTVSGWVHASSTQGLVRLEDFASLTIVQISAAAPTSTAFASLRNGSGSASISSSATISGWRHIAVTFDVSAGGAVTIKFYSQGALIGTDTTTYASGGWPEMRTMTLRGEAGVAYVGLWDRALTAAEILTQHEAGTTNGVAGETADVRADRLLSYADPVPSLSTTGTFTSTMSKQDVADKSLADALFECATAERGTIFVDTDGWPVLTSRSWRVASPVSFTIPAHALAAEVAWTLDDQQLTNSSTVDRMVGDESAGTARARNDASVATYGEQNKSLQVWLDTDAQLLDRANAEANIDAVAMPRSSELTVDVLTKRATIPAATLLAADIGQRIAVSGLPAEAPTADEFYIETIADRVTHTGWERTFTVSPRADYFTIADATYGQLDNVFVLAF